jgi:chromosome segregation ATPase
MSIAQVIVDAAGRARKGDFTFASKVDKAEAAVADARSKAEQNELDHGAEVANREAFLDQIAETGRTAETDATLRALDDHIRFFEEMRPRLAARLAKAEQALLDAEDEAAAKKRRDFAKSNLKAYDQHTGEIRRCLAPVPELLQALHKAVTEAQDANEKAGELAGAEPVDIRSLLDNAIAAAALRDWL